MQIESWMTKSVTSVKPRDSIEHARKLMVDLRVNQIPVVVDGRLVGIVTDRDLRDAFPSVFSPPKPHGRKAVPSEQLPSDPESVTVDMVMTENVVKVGPKDSMATAAKLMRSERVGAIPVVAGERLVGIITRSDVLDAFLALEERGDKRSAPKRVRTAG